jgi:hypothetical protein
MDGNTSAHASGTAMVHVCGPWQSCAICGDGDTRNWFISEDMMDLLPAEWLCDRCLSILRPPHSGQRNHSN